LSSFTARQHEGGEGARGKQKLIIGPWTHFWPLSTHFGDFQIPIAGLNPPQDISPRRWFDYHLKGIPNGIEDIPSVTYFVMGPFDGTSSSGNEWRTAESWPIAATETSYYLTPQLSLETTPSKEGQIEYIYDPNHVIPTVGGRNLFLESGPKDQSVLEKRSDIVVFTTEKLTEDLEVTGPLSAKLFFTSDQPDTDVVVRLCDVYPDGRSILISEGGCRLQITRFQNSNVINDPKKPFQELEIDLWATSMVFAKEHAIRISISSSSYPRYEKNLNLGLLECNSGKCQIAKNRILMGANYPSRLILPIVCRCIHDSEKGELVDSNK
jgi:putative CocE/NonD family hydrolase